MMASLVSGLMGALKLISVLGDGEQSDEASCLTEIGSVVSMPEICLNPSSAPG